MCGIAGIFALDSRPIDEAELISMIEALRHRGPDDAGTWIRTGIALGHRRLAIRDLSPAGHQPMSDASGLATVTYNGEIYNDRVLRHELEQQHGIRFRSNCDTEILPYGYLAWGDEFFNRIEGMFAFALWDARENALVLVRDGIGIKPLYYSLHDGVFRFGSEIKALLACPSLPRRIDARSLHKFVNQGYPGPEDTLLTGIKQLHPGSILRITRQGLTITRFWRPSRKGQVRSLAEAVDEFVPLWDKVIKETLASDVQVGVLQSGGIDSSLVAAAAQRSQGEVPLFTVAFDETSHDESKIAAVVSQVTQLPHTVVRFGDAAPLADTLQRVINQSDGQLADESLMALFQLSAHVRTHVKVVMTGDGGDELFGGYPTYRATLLARHVGKLMPRGLAMFAGRHAYHLSAETTKRLPATALVARFLLGFASGGAAAHAHWRRYLPPFLLPSLYGSGLRPYLGESPFKEYEALVTTNSGSVLDAALLADQQYHLPAGLLLKSDFMTMAHGLESRVPLLDRRIVEFAGRCHESLLTGATGDTKRVLRAALRTYGMPDVVTRAPKRGFNTPLASLLRTSLRGHAESVFVRGVERFEPFFAPDAVKDLWVAHRDRRVDHAYALWPLLIFGTWRATVA